MAKKRPVDPATKAFQLFKDLNKLLRYYYGEHKLSHVTPLGSDDNWTMMGAHVATFTSVGIYIYQHNRPILTFKSAKGGLWLEYIQTTEHNGKRIRKGIKTLIESPEQFATLLEWATGEKDILCKNADHWEYADEFHLWSFSA